jgi:hypothetical protein
VERWSDESANGVRAEATAQRSVLVRDGMNDAAVMSSTPGRCGRMEAAIVIVVFVFLILLAMLLLVLAVGRSRQ